MQKTVTSVAMTLNKRRKQQKFKFVYCIFTC